MTARNSFRVNLLFEIQRGSTRHKRFTACPKIRVRGSACSGGAEGLQNSIMFWGFLIAEPPELDLIRPDVLGEVARGQARRARFEQEHRHALLAKLFGDPAAAGARADNYRIVDFLIARHCSWRPGIL